MKSVAQYETWMKAIKDSCLEQYQITSTPSLEEVFKLPRLVMVITHSTPMSWIPIISVLTLEACKSGGGDRVPRGIMDRWFYSNPFTKKIAEFITQSETPQSFEELCAHFIKSDRTDVVVFPEGAHSFFGDPSQLQSFRSNRFIELAVKANSPLLLCTHLGSESWSLPMMVSPAIGALLAPFSSFFSESIIKNGFINLPFPKQKIKYLKVKCQLYHPQLSAADLNTDEIDKKIKLDTEAKAVHQALSEMLDSLRTQPSPQSEPEAPVMVE